MHDEGKVKYGSMLEHFFLRIRKNFNFFLLKEISNQFIVKYTSMNMIWLSGIEKSIERIY